MDIRELQTELNNFKDKVGKPALVVDGIAGKRTQEFLDELLGDKAAGSWSDARMLIGAEQYIYKEAGIYSGDVDGLIGELTRYARTVWEARKKGNSTEETWRDAEMAKPSPILKPTNPALKWPTQSNVGSFFGPVGENQVLLEAPFPFRIAWEPDKTITRFSCHKKVHDSLMRIWTNTLEHYTYDTLKKIRLDMFGGCLNVRKMRGGSAWSMHSWGIAQDVDPDRNQLKFGRANASLDDDIYKQFWKFVYDEGAISLGIERNFDWMHFQFARL